MNHTELLRIRVTQEMKTDLEMIAFRKGILLSELARKYLQEMIDKEGVPLPFQERG